jgi:hypothetical protein
MKIEVDVMEREESFGNDRFFPQCPITRAITEAVRSKCVKIKFIKTFVENGIELEYTGRKCEALDQIGGKHKQK